MGQVCYYHVPYKSLERLPTRLRDWTLHTITPQEAHKRHGVLVRVIEEEQEAREPAFVDWIPALDGVMGKTFETLIIRLPDGTWLTREDVIPGLLHAWRRDRLRFAAFLLALRSVTNDRLP